ncbi:phospholipid-binding protein MlaC [Arcobacter sp. CECT 8985]|uniref:MlaC/ttg2D family ABC transporter substrate-binding protein n=1 Tax=Arcobacter sp. CECT 8985 TaxID=1935424 RepID=UPI00100BF743|nr:ABC transporter substrate-binding protein [Arcobacter sp. CECT 8985]RXJ88179.1 toluene tolerance protein [Arcobacter sp. CECT 8985]
MIKKIFLITCLVTSLFAFEKNNIQEQMTQKIHKVLSILKDSSLKKKQRNEKIINIMDNSFDYNIMSMLSLGRTWKTISNDQRKSFSKAFIERLKESYIDKLELYNDQKIEINKLKQNKSRLILNTILIGKKENYPIDYKFYENKKANQWYIYDVNILGVSIIQTYRKQFDEYLKEKSIDDLIQYLKEKNSKA